MKYHPDRIPITASVDEKKKAMELFKLASLANEILSDDQSRREYESVFFSSSSSSSSQRQQQQTSSSQQQQTFEEFFGELFSSNPIAASRVFSAAVEAGIVASKQMETAKECERMQKFSSMIASAIIQPKDIELWVTLEQIQTGVVLPAVTSSTTVAAASSFPHPATTAPTLPTITVCPGAKEFTRYRSRETKLIYVLRIRQHHVFTRGGSEGGQYKENTTPSDLCAFAHVPIETIHNRTAKGLIRDLKGVTHLWSLARCATTTSRIEIAGAGLPSGGGNQQRGRIIIFLKPLVVV